MHGGRAETAVGTLRPQRANPLWVSDVGRGSLCSPSIVYQGRHFLSGRGLKRGHRGQHSLWAGHHQRGVVIPDEVSVESRPAFVCSRFRPLDTTASQSGDEHQARQQIRLQNMIVAFEVSLLHWWFIVNSDHVICDFVD